MERKLDKLRAFSDPTRLRILNLLREEEHCVGELVDALSLSQPKVSQHLATLKTSELVTCRKIGRWCFYRLCASRSRLHRSLVEDVLESLAQTPEMRADVSAMRRVMRSTGCGAS